MYARDVPAGTIFYHGTKADLKAGDLITPGFGSNFVERGLKHIYFSAMLEAATWGAELAKGEGRGRIYIVQPTGAFDDDPNLTDKKFPGNMTASYRSAEPLRVTGEVLGWIGHPPEQVQRMKDNVARMQAEGRAEIIED
jgi:rifampin ADP-ribosylating transferase